MKRKLICLLVTVSMAITCSTSVFAEEIPAGAQVITSDAAVQASQAQAAQAQAAPDAANAAAAQAQAATAATQNNGYVLVGNCTTSLRGSSASRINNITVGAARLNGLVVAPGQAVSVGTVILPRTVENGYQEAGAYLNGKVVQALGGGVCQISSTTYNAVMNAGLTVLKRYPHSMPVHYLPLGQDAAISAGSKDLVFANPYDTPILIQTIVDGKLFTVNVFVEAVSLQGRSYKLRAESTGPLSAKTYLDCYQNGILTGTLYVGSSTYMAPKE